MPEKIIRRAMLLGCSDGIAPQNKTVDALCATLQQQYAIIPEISPTLYRTPSGSTQPPRLRAETLQRAFLRDDIDAIFDLSGGDTANAVLPFLDFDSIRCHAKPFFGYSDLSVLLNPLREKSNLPVFYFQARFLTESAACRARFSAKQSVLEATVPQHYHFLQGNALHGTLVGGNIRCTLKLIGTPWQPCFSDHILFLESFSGSLTRIETMLWQYAQIGAFSQCRGILLGNFTELSKNGILPQLETMLCEIVDNRALPIVCTTEVGHQSDSLCLPYHVPLFLHA